MHTPFMGEGPNSLCIDAHRVGTETQVEYRVSWLQAFGVTDRSSFVDTVMITSQSQPFTDIGNPFSTPYPTSGYKEDVTNENSHLQATCDGSQQSEKISSTPGRSDQL